MVIYSSGDRIREMQATFETLRLFLVKGEFGKPQKAEADLPLLADIIDQSDKDIFDDVPDFHRQVKARLLKFGHTSQLLRETTLAREEFLNQAGKLKEAIARASECSVERCDRSLLQNATRAALAIGVRASWCLLRWACI